MPTAEQLLVIKTLKRLSLDHEIAIELFSVWALSGIVAIPPVVMERVIEAQRALDEGLKEYESYVREMQG